MPWESKRLRLKQPAGRTVKAQLEAAYGRRWGKASRAWLRAHPVCHCDAVRVWDAGAERVVAFAEPGTVRPAVLVDHVRPVTMGGPMWDPANWSALCRACHARKSARFG